MKRYLARKQLWVLLVGLFAFSILNASERITLKPVADSYVSNRAANENFGSKKQIIAKRDSSEITKALIKFNIPDLPADIKNVELAFYVRNATSGSVKIHKTSNNWTENDVNWNNRPTPKGRKLDKLSGVSKGWVTFNVTRAVNEPGELSFILITNSSEKLVLKSKETKKQPKLVITTGPAPPGDDYACTTPPIPPLVDSPFEIILADKEVAIGQKLNFSLSAKNGANLSKYRVSWFVDDPEDLQPNISGTSGSYTYHYPGRFRIVATLTNKSNSADTVKLINYANVYRPHNKTIYAASDFSPQGISTIGNPGSGEWCHHDYDVYYGKYYELWMQSDHSNPPSKALLLEALANGDYLHETFTEMFGWDLRTKNDGQKMVLCDDVQGASGGYGGMFWGNIGLNPDTGTAGAGLWLTTIHEFIHQWDFRGGLHLSGPESAHALTSSQEFLAYTLSGTARWTQGNRTYAVTPEFNDAHIERVMYNRYLNDDLFDWNTLYNDEMMEMEYGTHPLPENKEHMLIMGGVLMAFYRMHGVEGLRAYYQQIDVLLEERPEWSTGIGTAQLSNEQRTENMLLAMSRAVRFDVSDYFDQWKFPVSGQMRNILSQYPKSPMMVDNDKDGYSRLQGDKNDCDESVYPESLELSDSKDNNSNGLIDETIIDEKIQGDVIEVSAQLPLFIKGGISDSSDVDIYRFTVPSGQRALVTALTLDAPYAVALSDTGNDAGRPNKLFSGSYIIDGQINATVHGYSHIPAQSFIIDGDGTEKTIRVDASTIHGMNSNPGNYEITIHISDATNRDMSVDALVKELYRVSEALKSL